MMGAKLEPPPDLVSVGLAWVSGGDLCFDPGNFVVRVSWTVANAPDAGYHIAIDGVAGTTEPSAGSKTFDSGVGNVNIDPPHTEQLQLGPYTVRLQRDSDNSDVETMVTNTIFVDYQLGFCV